MALMLSLFKCLVLFRYNISFDCSVNVRLLLSLTLWSLQHSSNTQRANCRLLSEDSAAGEVLPADGWSDGQKW